MHNKSYMDINSFKCETCGNTFFIKIVWKCIRRVTRTETTLSVKHVEKRFFDKYSLEIHKKSHKDRNSFKCKTSGKRFLMRK